MNCKIIKDGDNTRIGTIAESISMYTSAKYFDVSITDSGKPYYSCNCSSLEDAEYVVNKNRCSKIYYIN